MTTRFLGFLFILAILATTCLLTVPATAGVMVLEKKPPTPILKEGVIPAAPIPTNEPMFTFRANLKETDNRLYEVTIFRSLKPIPNLSKAHKENQNKICEPGYWSKFLKSNGFQQIEKFTRSAKELQMAEMYEITHLPTSGNVTYAVTISRHCEIDGSTKTIIRESQPGFLNFIVNPQD